MHISINKEAQNQPRQLSMAALWHGRSDSYWSGEDFSKNMNAAEALREKLSEMQAH